MANTTLKGVAENCTKSDAALIVKAVNCHDDLLAALEDCSRWMGESLALVDEKDRNCWHDLGFRLLDETRAAIAKARV